MVEMTYYCDKCGKKLSVNEIYDIGVGLYDGAPSEYDCLVVKYIGQGFHLCGDCVDSIRNSIISFDLDPDTGTEDTVETKNVTSANDDSIWKEIDLPELTTDELDFSLDFPEINNDLNYVKSNFKDSLKSECAKDASNMLCIPNINAATQGDISQAIDNLKETMKQFEENTKKSQEETPKKEGEKEGTSDFFEILLGSLMKDFSRDIF